MIRSTAAAALLAALLLLPARQAQALTLEEVSGGLMCQCGCGLTVNSCNHKDCSSAIPMRQEIRRLIDEGRTREQITAAFVARYGEAVLAAPVKRGFDLTVWILPFFSILAGAAILAVVIGEWTRRRSRRLAGNPPAPSTASNKPEGFAEPSGFEAGGRDRYEDVFEREMREFDRGGVR